MIKSTNAKLLKRCLTTKTIPPQGYRKTTDDDLLWLKHDNMKSRNFLYSQKTLKRDYFITKVRQLEAKKAKQLDRQITNLPQFESPFELLHKNFYKT